MKIRYVGSFEQGLPALGIMLKPGEEFECEDEALCADLLRREQYFQPVVDILPMPERPEKKKTLDSRFSGLGHNIK